MKKRFIVFLFLIGICLRAQVPDYYKSIHLDKSGNELKQELSLLITNTHTHQLSYGDLWNVLKNSDRDPQNSNNILLIYGNENNDGKYARSRNRNSKNWNREHVFAKSLGNPNLGTEGPGADAHHLRPADESLNSDRGNLRFDDDRGAKAHRTIRGGWFPGDEWKGDVARMMMYMYVRYGMRCDPRRVAKEPYTISPDFPDIFLKWNIEDPVSDFEKQRNNEVAKVQGNRNPFIDNPYLATLIWGGTPAPNTWNTGGHLPVTPNQTNNYEIRNLRASKINPTNFTLTWDFPANYKNIAYYEVYIGEVLKQKTFTNTALIVSLKPETSYSFKVIAKKSNGEILSESAAFNLTMPSLENQISQSKNTQKIIFYPNPVSNGILNVMGQDLKSIKWLKIYDLQGNLLKNIVNPFIHDGSNKVDVSSLIKGIYILKTPNHYEKILIL